MATLPFFVEIQSDFVDKHPKFVEIQSDFVDKHPKFVDNPPKFVESPRGSSGNCLANATFYGKILFKQRDGG